MTTCITVLAVISCTLVGPRLSPREAAEILAPNQFHAPIVHAREADVVLIRSSVTAGPFGEFAPFPDHFNWDWPWLAVAYGHHRRFVELYGPRRSGTARDRHSINSDVPAAKRAH